jgi:hypothetical protein
VCCSKLPIRIREKVNVKELTSHSTIFKIGHSLRKSEQRIKNKINRRRGERVGGRRMKEKEMDKRQAKQKKDEGGD